MTPYILIYIGVSIAILTVMYSWFGYDQKYNNHWHHDDDWISVLCFSVLWPVAIPLIIVGVTLVIIFDYIRKFFSLPGLFIGWWKHRKKKK
jgi:hypothetical protein